MQSIHYSVIDIILIVAALECVLIYGLIVVARALPTPNATCRHLLGFLFLAIALDALATLLVWQTSLREAMAPFGGLVVAFASFAFSAKGPLLLLFVQTLVTPKFRLRPVHILHFSAFAMALAVAFTNSLDTTRITFTIESNMANPGSNTWWTLMRLTPCLYALAAIYTLRKMTALYDSHYTSNEYQYGYWIKALVWGYFAQWSLNLAVHIAGNHLPYDISNALGIANDIAILLMVNGLLFYCFKVMRTLAPMHPSIVEHQPFELADQPEEEVDNAKKDDGCEPASEPFSMHAFVIGEQSNVNYLPRQITPAANREDDAALTAIMRGIDERTLHLNPTLNVDKFSEAIDLAPRDVSRLINAHFDCSFSEFINAFRTFEAEHLLTDPKHLETTIIDIIGLAGFNSKSAFHRFFKRYTGLAPSDYRKLRAPTTETQ